MNSLFFFDLISLNPVKKNSLIYKENIDHGFFSTSSVKTDLKDFGANSTLFVAKVNKSDSGNYTCSIGPNQYYTVTVHVLNGK